MTKYKRLAKTLSRIMEASKEDEDLVDLYADSLDNMLDELRFNDQFGSEGQCDPRGDFRNGEWSIENQIEE